MFFQERIKIAGISVRFVSDLACSTALSYVTLGVRDSIHRSRRSCLTYHWDGPDLENAKSLRIFLKTLLKLSSIMFTKISVTYRN